MSLLERFEGAMEDVYGKLTDVSDPSTWNPPPAPGGHRGRYLWTDAFGVINFLTLYKEHAKIGSKGVDPGRYLLFAKQLVKAVHNILGGTRNGLFRLPRATDQEPLAGGLRIGKEDEHGANGDGQYHHYLTKWMLALNRLAMATGDSTYNRQAYALGRAIHPHFFRNLDTSAPRMVWKVSTDLSKPLVSSEGRSDAFDGYVTFSLVKETAILFGDDDIFEQEIADYEKVLASRDYYTPSLDTLDLGMSLVTAQWLDGEEWAAGVVARCFEKLQKLFVGLDYLSKVPSSLPFRDLGAAIGIACFADKTGPNGEKFSSYTKFSDQIIQQYEKGDSPQPYDLKPITRVMYATALIPGALKTHYLRPESTRYKS